MGERATLRGRGSAPYPCRMDKTQDNAPHLHAAAANDASEQFGAGAANDALAALWFKLDEARAVAACIALVQEHVSCGAGRCEQVDALARAVGALLDAAFAAHQYAEDAIANDDARAR